MRPRILFLALVNNVGMDRIIRAMASNGCECSVLSPPGFYCAQTRFAEHRFELPRHFGMWLGMPAVQLMLEGLLQDWPPDAIVPLDDVSSWLLRGMVLSQVASVQLTQLIQRSLGSASGYPACLNRFKLLKLASGLGVRTPHSVQANERATFFEAVAAWGYPVVVKSEFTCGGSGVRVAKDLSELETCAAGYFPTSLKGLLSLKSSAMEMVWRRAGIPEARRGPLVLQSHIWGRPAMTTVAVREGLVLESVSFIAELVNPPITGTSTVVRHIEHEEMNLAAQRVVRALGCSGFVSFDFMLESKTQHAFLIEMNARPIGTGHLGSMFGHDICGALVAELTNRPRPAPNLLWNSETLIALFPKELEREPENLERFQSGKIYLDLPADDPALVEAYLTYLNKRLPRHLGKIRTALALPPNISKNSAAACLLKWVKFVASRFRQPAGPRRLA